MVRILRAALALLNSRLRRRWLLLVPCAAFSAIFEMLATAGILLLIRLISDPMPTDRLAVLVRIRGRLGLTENATFNAAFAGILALFYLLKNALRLAETYAQQRCAADTAVWISAGLLERYLRAPYSLHLRRNSSEMLQNVHAATNQVSWVVLQSGIALISESLIVFAILSVLVTQLPIVALITATLAAYLMILLLWLTQHRHTRWGEILHEAGIHQMKHLRQSLAAVKEAQILGRELYFVKAFTRLRMYVGQIEAVRQTIEVVPRLVVETIFVGGLAALTITVWLQRSSGRNFVPVLGLFAYSGLRLLPSLHLIVYRANSIGSGAPAVEAVSRDWNELPLETDDFASDASTASFTSRIVFDGVSFTYDGAPAAGLSNVNLSFHRGESIGIVGPTGAGKTTLVDLMLGLLQPTVGRITVDSVDIRSSLRAWQKQIGYVPQAIYLVDDTIRRNIALAREDDEIDESRVIEAASMAQLNDFITSLPLGLDTVVGERGVKLSGGERQRIAVARALYRRPSVLVFDEATAALDNATEQALTATIRLLRGAKTIILIAHRLSTVQSCDRLVFVSAGKIVAVGPYEELVHKSADFQRLAAASSLLSNEDR